MHPLTPNTPLSSHPLTPSPAHPLSLDPHVASAHFVTAGIPPLGGWIKEREEDFFVEEQPAYQPCGEGEHVYLFVEKRGVSTLRAARIIAQHFGVHERAVGHAGLKDKRAVTRQVFSVHVPGKKPEDFPALQHERMTVLWADRHTNKLKPGHLAGNRFSIRVRGVGLPGVLVANRALEQLAVTGVPNRFGEQRFGYRLRNHLVGRALLLGDATGALEALLAPDETRGLPVDNQQGARELYRRGDFAGAMHAFFKEARTERRVLGELSRGRTPEQALRAIDRSERDFFLTAFQSAVFNAVLDARLREGLLGSLREGDLAFKHENGAVFEVGVADLGESLSRRVAAMEISPSGPLWGAEMKRAGGATGEAELAALAGMGVEPQHLEKFSSHLRGARRPMRVAVTDPEVEGGVDEHGAYVRLAFDLPRGAFATTVLREIIKPDPSRAGALTRSTDEEAGE